MFSSSILVENLIQSYSITLELESYTGMRWLAISHNRRSTHPY